jgi:ribosomal protein L21E
MQNKSKGFSKSNAMTPKYKVGQKVVITPVRNQHLSPSDSDLQPYAGKTGEVTGYHWISPSRAAGAIFIYTVRIGDSRKQIVLHEDEVEAYHG